MELPGILLYGCCQIPLVNDKKTFFSSNLWSIYNYLMVSFVSGMDLKITRLVRNFWIPKFSEIYEKTT